MNHSYNQIKYKNTVGPFGGGGDWTGAYKYLVGRPEGMRPLGRSRHRW